MQYIETINTNDGSTVDFPANRLPPRPSRGQMTPLAQSISDLWNKRRFDTMTPTPQRGQDNTVVDDPNSLAGIINNLWKQGQRRQKK